MHELSIAQTIVDRASTVSAQNGGARVTKIGLRIGAISGVEPDALRFGLEALTKDSPFDGVALDIELCKRRQRCTKCEGEFEPEGFHSACPTCQSNESACIAGNELDVTYFELEDPPCA
jgi:hydrogenase nickel incorporation protein HypA/HybF